MTGVHSQALRRGQRRAENMCSLSGVHKRSAGWWRQWVCSTKPKVTFAERPNHLSDLKEK